MNTLTQTLEALENSPDSLYSSVERPIRDITREVDEERLRIETGSAWADSNKERQQDARASVQAAPLIRQKFAPDDWEAVIRANDYATMAEMGRRDYFGFAFYILGYDKLQEDIHRSWCDWASDFTFLRKLRMEPREVYKSTVLNISFCLWVLVQERMVVRGVTGNNLRILIANAVGGRAADFGREMDSHFRLNSIFRECYGELINPLRWSVGQKEISTRTLQRKEASLFFTGKSSQLASMHLDIVICDDIANEKDRQSKIERDGTLRFFQDLFSLLHPDGLLLMVGTRWSTHDIYGYIVDELSPALENIGEQPFSIISEGCYLDDGITPRFPTILDEAKLSRLKIEKGSSEFASQYLNKPMNPESQIFKEEEMLYYDDTELYAQPQYLEYYMCGDPSLGKSATSDFSAILIVARHRRTRQLYLVEADLQRRSTEQFKEDYVRFLRQFKPMVKAGHEDNGFQSEVSKEIQKMIIASPDIENIRLTSIVNTGNKEERISSAESKIKIVKFHNGWRQRYRTAFEQIINFGSADYDDAPDCLEMILSHLANITSEEVGEALRINAYDAVHRGTGATILNAEF